MKGAVGTSMGGPSDSKKWAIKKNLPALIHAKDILKLYELGENDIRIDIIEACKIATTTPSFLLPYQGRMIHSCWIGFAKSGKLRGIRSSNYSQIKTNV